MALTDYVIMPSADYKAACDAIREKTGKTDTLKSGELAPNISAISSGGSDQSAAFFEENFPSDTWNDGEYIGSVYGIPVTMRYKYRKDKTDPKDIPFVGMIQESEDVDFEQTENLADFYLKTAMVPSGRISANSENGLSDILYSNPVVPTYYDSSQLYTAMMEFDVRIELNATQCGVKHYDGTGDYSSCETFVNFFVDTDIDYEEFVGLPEVAVIYNTPLQVRWYHEVDWAFGGTDMKDYKAPEQTITENGPYYWHHSNGYWGAAYVNVQVGETLGPLSVTENGTYNEVYESATVTWGEDTEYDFSVEVDGIQLRVKKLAGFSVPEDVSTFYNPEYVLGGASPDGTTDAIPLKELDIFEFYESGYISDDIVYAVVWIKDATLFNETVGDTLFENNSVYITDFLWVVSEGELAGATLTLTAPGKKLAGISSVTVDVDAEPNNQYKYITENGSYYPDEGFDGFSDVYVDVPVPDGYIQPSGTFYYTGNGTYDVRYAEYVNINVPIPDGYVVPSGTKAITENGTHNVSGYEQAEVDVPIPDGYIVPSGTLDINENGTHDVTEYSETVINVQPNLQEKVVTQNGTITADEGYDGLKKVVVAVTEFGNADDYYDGEIITE